ncbi:nucleotide sugar dehydrogenase [Chryseobacterium gotjawalense]|uniref:Nucleotide sugar dehydrogenase n=1 Tax=Chryseobacterium gotjawalense TaxID=3042315 RepID=A0ABY8RD44_9FLAO|nr:nucleotide sugar dehydrogenase [Chryseobacterium sp. wdc7]WHF51419.1 nucleotide sugar dehydrogenase [Chryseobacterium sp. wdc7]
MNHKIAVIGLGYVGLPLARLFATKYPVVGFDINSKRIAELNRGTDFTLEVEEGLLKAVLVAENLFLEAESGGTVRPSKGLFCSSSVEDIRSATIYIITVPTPVDNNKKPDLTLLYKASKTVGTVLKKGDTVIYESTVYPGATEEECVPVLEKISGLKFNKDFFAGYSPERINPGDKEHTVEKILKVTSGSTEEIGQLVNDLYQSVITAGTHLAPSIKVAEAAKVIENSQRDINIAFINELAKIFNLMNINTQDVLEAAGTKWNFLPFKPGLVGGHCIGVDPYYLAQQAQKFGYNPEIILAGRKMNDSMGAYVASQVVKAMIKKDIPVKDAHVLMLGITFKENCPDVRNTKIVDVVAALNDYGITVTIFDPWANPAEVKNEYGLEIVANLVIARAKQPQYDMVGDSSTIAGEVGKSQATAEMQSDTARKYDAIILGVAHREFLDLDLGLHLKDNALIYDVKGVLQNADARL